MPDDEALEIIRSGRGKHFDPEVLDAFLATVPVDYGSRSSPSDG